MHAANRCGMVHHPLHALPLANLKACERGAVSRPIDCQGYRAGLSGLEGLGCRVMPADVLGQRRSENLGQRDALLLGDQFQTR